MSTAVKALVIVAAVLLVGGFSSVAQGYGWMGNHHGMGMYGYGWRSGDRSWCGDRDGKGWTDGHMAWTSPSGPETGSPCGMDSYVGGMSYGFGKVLVRDVYRAMGPRWLARGYDD